MVTCSLDAESNIFIYILTIIVHGMSMVAFVRVGGGGGGKFTPLAKIPTTIAIDFKLGMIITNIVSYVS